MNRIELTVRRLGYPLAAAALALASAGHAVAGDHVYTASDPLWKSECAGCHIAYPPALLSAESWRALMAELDRHFGVDASVDAETARHIGDFLQANAARGRRAARERPTLRITETRWFRKEHDDVAPSTWTSPAVKSAANCEACHTQAANGDFRERHLRVPR